MRLLYWIPFYSPYIGGMETISTQLVGALRTRGYEVCIATSQRNLPLPDEDVVDGIPGHALQPTGALRGLGNSRLQADP